MLMKKKLSIKQKETTILELNLQREKAELSTGWNNFFINQTLMLGVELFQQGIPER